MSTPFRLEVTVVLAKRYGDRKHVSKALIVELAVAYGYNSSSIWWIETMFQPQNSGPGLCGLHCCCQGNRGPPNPLDKVRDKVMAITSINRGQVVICLLRW